MYYSNIFYEKKKRPPFITFHLGFLGYLAIYEVSIYEEVITELYNNNKKYSFEQRNLIECNIYHKEQNSEPILKETIYALNEILVERGNQCSD